MEAKATEAPRVEMLGKLTEHVLPDLPYPYDGLEPYIDEKTMRLHHDNHHAAYVNALNKAECALAAARAANDFAMVQHYSRRMAFNGGGHFLHSMFWKIMAPPGRNGGGEPSGDLRDMLVEDFGSVDTFRSQFTAAAMAVEGSGWGLLHYRPTDDCLIILEAENQHKLSPWGTTPIFGVDVWEHAYYLKYNNMRNKYIEAFWHVVNWDQVNKNLTTMLNIRHQNK